MNSLVYSIFLLVFISCLEAASISPRSALSTSPIKSNGFLSISLLTSLEFFRYEEREKAWDAGFSSALEASGVTEQIVYYDVSSTEASYQTSESTSEPSSQPISEPTTLRRRTLEVTSLSNVTFIFAPKSYQQFTSLASILLHHSFPETFTANFQDIAESSIDSKDLSIPSFLISSFSVLSVQVYELSTIPVDLTSSPEEDDGKGKVSKQTHYIMIGVVLGVILITAYGLWKCSKNQDQDVESYTYKYHAEEGVEMY